MVLLFPDREREGPHPEGRPACRSVPVTPQREEGAARHRARRRIHCLPKTEEELVDWGEDPLGSQFACEVEAAHNPRHPP